MHTLRENEELKFGDITNFFGNQQMFRRIMSLPSSELKKKPCKIQHEIGIRQNWAMVSKMELMYSSETSVDFQQIT
jgi:hypothetical protein